MSLQTDVLATFLAIMVLLGSTRSGSFNNRTKMPGERDSIINFLCCVFIRHISIQSRPEWNSCAVIKTGEKQSIFTQ